MKLIDTVALCIPRYLYIGKAITEQVFYTLLPTTGQGLQY